MSDLLTLEATRRDVTGKKVRALRRGGKLPAVIYGAGLEPAAILLDMRTASRALREVTLSTLVDIKLEGEKHTVLVRERQYDVIRRELSHIDFLAVSMTETLRTSVPLRLIGEAPAIKEFNAMIMQELEYLEIEALPADLPEVLEVDVAGLLELGSNVTVADLKLGSKVNILADEEMVVAVAIAATRLAEEEEEDELLDDEGAEPELIERGKREEEDEE